MAKITKVYCELEGVVYVSKDRIDSNFCTSCHLSNGDRICKDIEPNRICSRLNIIWKRLV